MYFYATNGWNFDDDKGYYWLNKASENSGLACLLLGMLSEVNGDIKNAKKAYEKGIEKEVYYCKTLYENLEEINSDEYDKYNSDILSYIKVKKQKCMKSCQNEYPYSENECEVYFCNYTILNLYTWLHNFRTEEIY